jgi:hypothetical protein
VNVLIGYDGISRAGYYGVSGISYDGESRDVAYVGSVRFRRAQKVVWKLSGQRPDCSSASLWLPTEEF